MHGDELQTLLADFLSDLQRPDVLWQTIALGASLLVAWAVAWHFRRRQWPAADRWRVGRSGLNRVLFPLIALALVMAVRVGMRRAFHVHVLDIAVPLLLSWAVIRAVVFALRQAFAPSGGLAFFERFVAIAVWGIVALHIVGLLPEIIGSMDAVTFSVGKQKLSLWLVTQGAFTVMVTLLAALWASSLIDSRLMQATALDASLRVVFGRLAKALLIVVAVLISLPLVGIDLTTLSVFGGALGVGLGLGLQKIASNYVAGFTLLLDRSIRMGNMISVDKYAGEVTQITTRYTVLRGLNGVESIVPNELLIASVVQNETYTNPQVRQALQVQVSYATEPERAMQLLTDVARRHPRVLHDPEPRAYLVRFADSGIDLELGFWIGDPLQGSLNVRSELNLEIWKEFKRAGIDIPFPQREVRLVGARCPT